MSVSSKQSRSVKKKVVSKQVRKVSPKRKKKTFTEKYKYKFILLILVLLILSPFYYGKIIRTTVSTTRWIKDLFIFNEYPHYEKFNVKIPRRYYVHGIDVSSYQQKIKWNLVDSMSDEGVKINFAFIKATEGVTLVDPYFQRNWRESKENGIIRGAYHYFKPKKSGQWQAHFFLQTAKFEMGDLPPVLDIEEIGNLSKKELQENVQAFLDEVERKVRVKPIIYTGYKFYVDYLKGKFDDYPLWVAHYYQPKLKLDNTQWKFWQHADNATVDGIRGKTDLNVFNGDEEDLSALLIQHHLY
ncbi:glycoside hydrolase family 25 protein [Pseudopedobacter beijingensis]|uniref:Glycoside hydrolase family 25 protein n=1 Tax=Pseudopedobacter beijingensis TaxID=1207056 RepID=A0ABW4IHX8_9SPHI